MACAVVWAVASVHGTALGEAGTKGPVTLVAQALDSNLGPLPEWNRSDEACAPDTGAVLEWPPESQRAAHIPLPFGKGGRSDMRMYTIGPQSKPGRQRALAPEESLSMFAMDGEANLLDEADLGIINGMLTTNVTYRDVLSFRGLYAPPYVSSDFELQAEIGGEKVATRKYTWHPFAVEREGDLSGVTVSSQLVLCAQKRAAVMAMTFTNRTSGVRRLPLQFTVRGGLDYVRNWEFGRPNGVSPATTTSEDNRLVKGNNAGAIVIAADLARLRWGPWSSRWETAVRLAPGERKRHFVCVAIGDPETASEDCRQVLGAPEEAIAAARREWAERVSDLFARLPAFECTDRRLKRFYDRSLLALLLNQWQVPEFLLHPYYSTGSISGGCVCSYLWDFGEPWELLPLFDPAADREHIKRFLTIDLTAHFAFSPITGDAFGPWYPVNQEKIIRSIYYYVLFTGDTGFLDDIVAGKTVLDWVICQAMHGDDPGRPVALMDYGNGNHHLELRGKHRYDNYLPDLNGRRYDSCVAAYQLSRLAGREAGYLLARAAALKGLLKDVMWSPADRWFYHLDPDMGKHLRYTIQMFKLIGSDVLDREEEEGLLTHINEREFLSAYGMHSMSKLDEAYDQADIDNGGGGSYVSFPPQIAERLYKAGHPEIAEDILRRILWWGERLPYWGDSQVANAMDYRRDTPLQCSIGAAAGAQAVIFGMFGVSVTPDGDIIVNPRPPSFSPDIRLTGLTLRDCRLDIEANRRSYQVTANGQVVKSRTGSPIMLRPERPPRKRHKC